MGKIRKQPKRSSKKQKPFLFRNPFRSEMPLLPTKVAESLQKIQQISMPQLQQLILQPQNCPQQNLRLMKDALELQETRINDLSNQNTRIKALSLNKENHINKQHQQLSQKSNHPLLESCVGLNLNIVDWMMHQNESVSFF